LPFALIACPWQACAYLISSPIWGFVLGFSALPRWQAQKIKFSPCRQAFLRKKIKKFFILIKSGI
jgi:hypothetical protein